MIPLNMPIEIKIDFERCKGCGLCIENCSKNVLETSNIPNNKSYFPIQVKYQEKCTGCSNCAIMCPDTAIMINRT